MFKKLIMPLTFFIGLSSQLTFASPELDKIERDCAMDVESYGLTDAEAIRDAIQDCVDSMMLYEQPVEQDDDVPSGNG